MNFQNAIHTNNYTEIVIVQHTFLIIHFLAKMAISDLENPELFQFKMFSTVTETMQKELNCDIYLQSVSSIPFHIS